MGNDAGIGIEGYEIVGRLGQGGMGTVYVARQLDFDREVAIKVIHPHLVGDEAFAARFRSEMRIAIALHHPHIVPVYAAGESSAGPFIAMGLVPGENLAALIERRGRIPPEEAVGYVRQIASALDEAHRRQVVHRDVKPGNVLIDNRVPHAYLTDFGLARSLDASQHFTGTGQIAVTVPFAAPEQLEGERIDGRADTYALACLLFNAMTGEGAFRGDSPPSVMWAKMNDSRTPRLGARGLTPALDPVLDRALARDPDRRYTTASEFADDAAAALAGSGRTVPTPPPPPPLAQTEISEGGGSQGHGPTRSDAVTTPMPRDTPRAGWFRRVGVALGALALVTVGAGVALLVSESSDPLASSELTSSPSGGDTNQSPAGTESASDDGSDSSGGRNPNPRPRPNDTTPEFASFTGSKYTADVPSGWEAESIDEPESGNRLVSQWRNPDDDNTSVLIDSSDPGPDATPIESAATVRAQTSQADGYSEISFAETTIDGQPAAEWVFDLEGDRRVDYFFNSCDMGFAVLGSTSPEDFATWEPRFRRVAESVKPYCG